MVKDEHMRARRSQAEWTPAHGTEKRATRQRARTTLRRWTRRLVDAVLSRPSPVDLAQLEDEEDVGCECAGRLRGEHDLGCPWRLT